MVALREALGYLRDHPARTDTDTETLIVCTDSPAALSALRSGPAKQRSSLNRDVWDALISLAGAEHRRIRLQWVPSHCGLRGNEKADALAKAASGLPQEEVPVDTRTIYRAAARWARARAASQRPQGWYRHLMGTTARDQPGPSTGRRRPSAASRSLVGIGAVPAPHRWEHGPGVRRVPRSRVPRWTLPPLQRGAGHAEPRPAAVPGADAPPVPDHRQHPLPKGRRGSGGLVHRGHGGRVPETTKPLGFTVPRHRWKDKQEQQQPRHLATPPPRDLATSRSRDPATRRPRDFATSRLRDPWTPRPGDLATS